MPLSIVTFADLGKKTNLKTTDILPVIDECIKQGELKSIVCRINDGYVFPKTYSMINKWRHYFLSILTIITRGFIFARGIEERTCDNIAASLIGDALVVVFHPEYFFQKSVKKIKERGMITVGIATMAHVALNAQLEKEEQELLGLPYTDRFYQELLDTNGDMPDFDYLIAVSDFVKTSYVERGFPADKIFVAPLDAVLPISEISTNSEKTFRVVYTAHTNMLKGLHYLLDAWQQLTIPNKELVIIGMIKKNPKNLFKKYQSIINSDPSITWVGKIAREQVAEYYQGASAFVLPSLTEGNPRVVLEAMAAGIPVITTEHAPSLVQNDISGFIVPIRSAQAIKEKLEFLYHNPEVRVQMGMHGQEIIKNKQPFGPAVFEIYQKISNMK